MVILLDHRRAQCWSEIQQSPTPGCGATYREEGPALISTNGIFEACLLTSKPSTSCGAPCVIRLMCPADEDDSSSDGQCREAVWVLFLRKGHMSWDCRRSAGALPLRPTVTLALTLTWSDSGVQRKLFLCASLPCNSVISPKPQCVCWEQQILFTLVRLSSSRSISRTGWLQLSFPEKAFWWLQARRRDAVFCRFRH